MDDESGVARFLASHGEGLHHVCFLTDDLPASPARGARRRRRPSSSTANRGPERTARSPSSIRARSTGSSGSCSSQRQTEPRDAALRHLPHRRPASRAGCCARRRSVPEVSDVIPADSRRKGDRRPRPAGGLRIRADSQRRTDHSGTPGTSRWVARGHQRRGRRAPGAAGRRRRNVHRTRHLGAGAGTERSAAVRGHRVRAGGCLSAAAERRAGQHLAGAAVLGARCRRGWGHPDRRPHRTRSPPAGWPGTGGFDHRDARFSGRGQSRRRTQSRPTAALRSSGSSGHPLEWKLGRTSCASSRSSPNSSTRPIRAEHVTRSHAAAESRVPRPGDRHAPGRMRGARRELRTYDR